MVIYWTGALSLKKNDYSSPNSHQLPIAAQIDLGLHDHPAPCWILSSLIFTQVFCMLSQPLWVHIQLSCCIWKTPFHCSHQWSLILTISPPSLPWQSLRLARKQCGADTQYRTEHSTDSYSPCWLLLSLHINCHRPLEDISLNSAERSSIHFICYSVFLMILF